VFLEAQFYLLVDAMPGIVRAADRSGMRGLPLTASQQCSVPPQELALALGESEIELRSIHTARHRVGVERRNCCHRQAFTTFTIMPVTLTRPYLNVKPLAIRTTP
jgi:hypothetical protein